jgi:hypothetical protein
VVFDQEHDQFGVFVADAVLAAELLGVGHAELGVVAAAALGDVVEQRRQVQQPRLRKVGHQLAAERVFVRMLGHREAAHIAHHHQDVLVHRVDVEQVVLHLADDLAEVGQVAAQHRHVVHAAQRVDDALPAPAGCAGTARG